MPYVTCPKCRAESLAPRELIGLIWDCPTCRAEIRVTEDGGEAGDVPVRRPRRRRSKSPLVPMLVGGGVLAVVIVGVIVMRATAVGRVVTGPAAYREGENWTHKELAEHLNAKGVKVTVVPAIDLGGTNRPAWFYNGTSDTAGTPRVCVYLCPDERAAKEAAGAYGGTSFAWGRFAIGGFNERLLNEIRAAIDR